MCGGTVEVFVHELRGTAREVCAEAFDAVAREATVGGRDGSRWSLAGAKLAVVEGRVLGGFGGTELLDHTVARDLAALSERRTSAAAPLRRRRRGARRRAQRAPARVRRATDARARRRDRLLVGGRRRSPGRPAIAS